jgi:hypothetical protein
MPASFAIHVGAKTGLGETKAIRIFSAAVDAAARLATEQKAASATSDFRLCGTATRIDAPAREFPSPLFIRAPVSIAPPCPLL